MSALTYNLSRHLCTPGVAPENLPSLAARFRNGGLCLVFWNQQQELQWYDDAAGAFFVRYAIPLLRQDSILSEKLRRMSADNPVAVFNSIAGVTLAACPVAERRQLTGTLGVLCKPLDFGLGENVIRNCSRLSLDASWLAQQAQAIPGYSRPQIQLEVLHLAEMFRDRLMRDHAQAQLDSLSEQLANSYEELSLMYQISSGMHVNRPPADFFRELCQEVLAVMKVGALGVFLTDGGTTSAQPHIAGTLQVPDGALQRLATELLETLRQRNLPILLNDLSSDKHLAWLAPNATQVLAVPLQRQQNQLLGCLYALDKQEGEFDSVDAKLLGSIANESSIYLENSRLFADVHGLMMGLLHSLTSAVDAKDAYTCGHSERVALLSRQLAIQSGLAQTQVEQIYMAGLLHDVGKIGIPESVLQKTGKLTAEEFEIMKKHPQIGARILADIKQIQALIPGVLYHHERYDGKGYPAGLAATNIPQMGRIICLADCFDAMTSSRTYRKALPLELALAEIRRCAGTQFDPALAEAFLRIGADALRELISSHTEKAKKLLDMQQALRAA